MNNVGGSSESVLVPILGLVVLSVLLFAAGLWLRRRGMLSPRGVVIAWAVLTVLPLFGAGYVLIGTDTWLPPHAQTNAADPELR